MKIQFFGATQEVTGSCYLVECAQQRVLVDCGLLQGKREKEARNALAFPFDVNRLDAVILTHAHLDHSGRLPLLVKAGFKGKIFTHAATRDLCQIMLRDSANIQESDANSINRKRERKHLPLIQPLYDMHDVENTLPLFETLPYQQKVHVTKNIQLRLQDAGHIIGSAIAEVFLQEGEQERKCVFSGDLGHINAPILKDPTIIESADWLIMESTYGDRNHRSWQSTYEELGEAFTAAKHHRGNILIPAFTVGRTQELLYIMQQHADAWGLPHWHVYLDSPMAIEATKVYAKHWQEYDSETKAAIDKFGSPYALPHFHLSQTTAESMALNRIESGAIFIAGNGMCSSGRIMHHLKHNLWRPNCHLLIIGYQAHGTLGRQLVDGAKRVRIYGETITVAAQIHTIGGLSAHADQANLLQWIDGFKPTPKICLIHGEEKAMQTFAQVCKKRYNCQVTIPKYEQIIELND